jgi:hypothetical protein
VPAPPDSGVWVVDENENLITGCCIYPCQGPYALAEHFASNPGAPMRLVHAACSMTANGLASWAQMNSKLLVVGSSLRGIDMALLRAGFHEHPELTLFTSPPNVCVGEFASRKLRQHDFEPPLTTSELEQVQVVLDDEPEAPPESEPIPNLAPRKTAKKRKVGR